MEEIGRNWTPEGEIFGIDWATWNSGEQKRRAETKKNETPLTAAEQAAAAKVERIKNQRSSLLMTPGGSQGEEVLSGGVSKRARVLGN